MISATYSPDDNKLRLYASSRLDKETYDRVKAAGFRWAPKQDLFFTTWAPRAEDTALELAGEIEDEDKSLVERAEERADRFEDYSAKRGREAEGARKAVAAIADGIPFGQPILVGHHSERRARKDAQRIKDGMRKTVKLWETSQYWQQRAKGALSHAKYKELPSVRARRIKTLEADLRKRQRNKAEAEKFLKAWSIPNLTHEQALRIANVCHLSLPPKEGDKPDWSHQPSAYDGLTNNYPTLYAARTVEEVVAAAQEAYPKAIAYQDRWITHYENRLTYERAMLEDAGGTVADRTGPEKGGAVRCWASAGHGRGWSYIQKVNKVSVTVLDNWGNGGRDFRRNIEFDKLQAVMTKAEVDEARAVGRLREIGPGKPGDPPVGFFLLDAPPPIAPKSEPEAPIDAKPFEEMRETLRNGGVKAIAAPQLFPTPPALAERLIAAADIHPGHRVLEPSAGTGALLEPLFNMEGTECRARELVAVEINHDLAKHLRRVYACAFVHEGDFLDFDPPAECFDRIVMNPPFADQQDIRHVEHALKFLKPDGRLVAIMSAGVTFRQDKAAPAFRALITERGGSIEELPADSFATSGTGVRAVLATIPGAPSHHRAATAGDFESVEPQAEKTAQGLQTIIPGAERSAKQAAQAREEQGRGKIRPRKPQQAPGGLFAPRESEQPKLF